MFQIGMQGYAGMGMGIGNGLFGGSMGIGSGMQMGAFAGLGGVGAFAGAFGADSCNFSGDAFSGGASGFNHPLLSGGMGMPSCGMNNGMGMVPGMQGMQGGQGMQNQQMMQMMMQMLMQMMQMMQQQMGMNTGMMPGMGMGMPGMGNMGSPMGMGMPGMGNMGSPMGMGMPGMGNMGSPMGMGMPGGGGYGSPVGMIPGGGQQGGFNPGNAGGVGNTGGNYGTAGVGGVGQPQQLEFKGGDPDMSKWIDNYLAERGSPAAGHGAGEMFVKYGKQYNVDPMALLAISQHETNHGKLGVGVNKMLGVGAYDANPNGKTPFDGMENQIRSGAKTFNNLRRKGGSNPDAPLAQQLAAVNKAGWATDPNWHTKVGNHYNSIAGKAMKAGAEPTKGVAETGQAGGGVQPFNGNTVRPVDGGRVSSEFGPRWGRMHKGIDIAAPTGTPVKSYADGVISRMANDPKGYGNWVEVKHPDGSSSRYGHLSKFGDIKVGQQVGAGSNIGAVGSTGHSTGSHLHFEVRDPKGNAVNPREKTKI
jgi:murein DD-endopeptidase MepM/ murein hydrolase activator NlpD